MKKLAAPVSSFLLLLATGYSLLAPASVHAADPVINYGGSSIKVDKTTANADGIDNVIVTVTMKDYGFQGVSGQHISIASSRDSQDDIEVINDITDQFGKAAFRITSLVNGQSTYTAWVNGQSLATAVTVTYGNGLTFPISPGDLIKIPDDNNANTLSDTAVYYFASNGRRYVFSNEKVYFSWYRDFSNVKIIPIDQMSLIPIGANVTYKPGYKLVKFQTDIKTYLPTKGGTLRWVQTEAVAKGLFGDNWNQHVDDISEAFYVNYKFGTPIGSALDAPIDIISQQSADIGKDKGL